MKVMIMVNMVVVVMVSELIAEPQTESDTIGMDGNDFDVITGKNYFDPSKVMICIH